jgi:hypothetical protein
MPEPGLVAEVQAVDWRSLKAPYDAGERVRDVVLGLASGDEAEVRQAWQDIYATVLQHQGTVYPATAAAAPFLCRIALNEGALWRAALIEDLALMSTGNDDAPHGTAQAVRDAIRPYVADLAGLWGTEDQGLDMALVALSVAFPVEAAPVVPKLRDWFGQSEQSLRTGLGLALGFHSAASDAVRRIIDHEVRESICWVVRTENLISYSAAGPGSPRENEEPYIDSPIPEAIHLARRLQRGAEEKSADFSPVYSFLLDLMTDHDCRRVIKYPGLPAQGSSYRVAR